MLVLVLLMLLVLVLVLLLLLHRLHPHLRLSELLLCSHHPAATSATTCFVVVNVMQAISHQLHEVPAKLFVEPSAFTSLHTIATKMNRQDLTLSLNVTMKPKLEM
jgi:hypothetical protein